MTEETTICHNIDKTADDDNTGQAIYDPFLKNTGSLIEIIPNLRVRRILCRTHPLPHPLLQRKMRRTRKFGMISINLTKKQVFLRDQGKMAELGGRTAQ